MGMKSKGTVIGALIGIVLGCSLGLNGDGDFVNRLNDFCRAGCIGGAIGGFMGSFKDGGISPFAFTLCLIVSVSVCFFIGTGIGGSIGSDVGSSQKSYLGCKIVGQSLGLLGGTIIGVVIASFVTNKVKN